MLSIRAWRSSLPVAVLLAAALMGCNARDAADGVAHDSAASAEVRPLDLGVGETWIGNAVCYGPHRDGQRPGGPSPSTAELREDLALMSPHWKLLRIYAASEFAETLLSVIREDGLEMKVVLGTWIAVEERRDSLGAVIERFPDAVAANRREVDAAVRLANVYPDHVVAVSVGNETQIFWSAHRSPLDLLVGHVRRVRSSVSVPVTVADDFNFWNKPESRAVAGEIDFVLMHAHPMWNGLQIEAALPWLREQVDAVQALHPDRPVVLGETGWATSMIDEGEQGQLIKGRPGEAQQKRFYEEVRAWAADERRPVFFFEAFDENWKGGGHPDEVEKHWGLFNADRSPKLAMSPARGG